MLSNFLKHIAGSSASPTPKPSAAPRGSPATRAVAAPAVQQTTGWSDDENLFHFGDPEVDRFSIRDSVAGVCVFGTTGSGKTSASGGTIAPAYLRAGYGALVLCVKPEEAGLWKRYAAEAGRLDDLVLFGTDPRWTFNFLDYEARRPGVGAGLTENLVQLFVEVAAIGKAEVAGGKGDDPFWDLAKNSLIRNTIDLLMLARQPLTLGGIFDVLRSAPLTEERAKSRTWHEEQLCGQLLAAASSSLMTREKKHDLVQVNAYWTREFPTMPDRTRGCIVEMFRTMAEALLRGKMHTLFCERSTVIPEHVLAGKIIVVDLPVKEWGEVGRYAGVLWKYCLQKAIERRSDNCEGRARPVTIWADEFQYFISKYDTLFQTTARSSRAATVYLTQSLSGLLASLGGESNGKARVEALLGNLDTKIFHANSDRETNTFAADLIGKRKMILRNHATNWNSSVGQGCSFGSSEAANEHIDYELQPREFTLLRKGGPMTGFAVDAVVFQTGRPWSSGKQWRRVVFEQRRHASEARREGGAHE